MAHGLNNGFDPHGLQRVDQWMQRCIDERRFAGNSVLIARHGEVVHQSAFGKRSLADDLPFELDTIVRIYSMTKMIVSTALMVLAQEGRFNLDRPVSDYLPEFSDCRAMVEGATSVDQTEPVAAPTLHQLLTHTSGMTYGFNPGLLAQHYASEGIGFEPGNGDLATMAEGVAQMPLAFRPGTRWEYSVGIDIIGRVIEIISGQPLGTFLQERIFDPLGMVDTHFRLPGEKVGRFADCYEKRADDPLALFDAARESPFLTTKMQAGGGGLLSTLQDYFRFGEMIRRGGELNGARILSNRTLAFMRRNHLPGDIASMGPSSFAEMPMAGMGFGIGGAVVLDPAIARMMGSVGDFGWGGLASTFFWTDPVEQITCIFFTQLLPSSSYPNRAELKAIVHGALVD